MYCTTLLVSGVVEARRKEKRKKERKNQDQEVRADRRRTDGRDDERLGQSDSDHNCKFELSLKSAHKTVSDYSIVPRIFTSQSDVAGLAYNLASLPVKYYPLAGMCRIL